MLPAALIALVLEQVLARVGLKGQSFAFILLGLSEVQKLLMLRPAAGSLISMSCCMPCCAAIVGIAPICFSAPVRT